MLDIASHYATIVGGLGTFLAVLWAVILYLRTREDKEAERFRADIVGLINRYEEMSVVFQNNIVTTNKLLFDITNYETKAVLQKTLESLNEPNYDAAKTKFETYEREVSEWVLYHLTLGGGDKPRFECYEQLQSIRGFLPVLYEFVDKIGSFLFFSYKNTFSPNTIRKYVIELFKDLWNIKENSIAPITDEQQLIVVWRNLVSIYMNQLSSNVELPELFQDVHFIIDDFAELYLRLPNHGLWKSHLSELKVGTQGFQAPTKTETLVNIVKWKIGKSDPDLLAKLVSRITLLESKLST